MDPTGLAIGHTTTYESVAEHQQTTYQNTTIAVGHKRTFDEAQIGKQQTPHHPAAAKRPGHSRQHSNLPKLPPTLSASAIVSAGDDLSEGPSQYTQRIIFA